MTIAEWWKQRHKPETTGNVDEDLGGPLIHEDELEQYDHDMRIVSAQGGTINEEKLQRKAEKVILSAAEDSLQRIHAIKMGRCPDCGHHVRQHLFASICDHCGWHTFEVPRQGSVRVHITNGPPVEGQRCYVMKTGVVLVVIDDVVRAKIPTSSVSWIEYLWDQLELGARHRQVLDRMSLLCAWCNQEANPEADGFHMAQVAFGAAQERYCFCCDDCYEAFRKMYPARVHRNCYERDCASCDLCMKRYSDDEDGIRMLAKDYLKIVKQARTGSSHE